MEIINTGTELMLGYVLNTHGAWLGSRMEELGLRVERQTTVPDGMPVWDALKEAAERSPILIVTGGLGPTSDDVTREIAAKLFDRELVDSPAAMLVLKSYFEKRNREMSPSNLKQAKILEGSEVLDNPNGTAPGLYLPPGPANPAVFLLPGPPQELHPMFYAHVRPRLEALCHAANVEIPIYKTFKTVGIGESLLSDRVDMLLTSIPGLEVGYCAHPGEVDVRLIGSLSSVEEGSKIIHSELGDFLVDSEGSSLEEALVALLKEKGLVLSTAESCTGGMIAARITDVPGSSSVFKYGWVTYADEAKNRTLGVDADMLKTKGAVSEEVARAMAEGALEQAKADIAVAVTGFAGPEAGTDEEPPVGTVWIAWARKGRATIAKKYYYPNGRAVFRKLVVLAALTGVFRLLKGLNILER